MLRLFLSGQANMALCGATGGSPILEGSAFYGEELWWPRMTAALDVDHPTRSELQEDPCQLCFLPI